MLNNRETKCLEDLSSRGVLGQVAILGGRRTEEQAKLAKAAASAFIRNGFLVRTTGNRSTDADVFDQAVVEDVEGSILVTLPWLQEPASSPELDPLKTNRRLTVNDWAVLLGEPKVDEFGRDLEDQASEEERLASRHVFEPAPRLVGGEEAVDERGEAVMLTSAQVERRARAEYFRFRGALQDKARWMEAVEGGVAKFRALSMSTVDDERFLRDGVEPVDYRLAEGLAAAQTPGSWEKLRKTDRKRRVADCLAVGTGDDEVDLLIWLPDMGSITGGLPRLAADYAKSCGVPTLLLARSSEDSIAEFAAAAALLLQEAPHEDTDSASDPESDGEEEAELELALDG